MDDLLAGIADLIDRAGDPHAYAGLAVGNEILIIGTNLSGKKSFAQRVAKEARLDRLITVYNPRNGDALAKAKSLVQSYSRQKIMLLLPRIDEVFEQEDEELLSELEALIEDDVGAGERAGHRDGRGIRAGQRAGQCFWHQDRAAWNAPI